MPAERAGVSVYHHQYLFSDFSDFLHLVYCHDVRPRHLSIDGRNAFCRTAIRRRYEQKNKQYDEPPMVTSICDVQNSRNGTHTVQISFTADWTVHSSQIYHNRKTDQCGVMLFGTKGESCLFRHSQFDSI